MIGVSATTSRGESTAQSIASTEAKCGYQSIHRDYANDIYDTFMTAARAVDVNTSTQTSIRTTHVSWNPDASLLQSENPPDSSTQFSGFDPTVLQQYLANGGGDLSSYGTETQKNIQWLLSIPSYHKVILNPWHEADEYQSDRTYGTNYGMFRNGFRIIADIIHAFNNPHWQVCLLLTAYAFKGNAGNTRKPSNFLPCWNGFPETAKNYIDIMGVDVYNEGSLNGDNWWSPSASIGIPMNNTERVAYQTKYGGTDGWRTSDDNAVTWTNGFPGYCESYSLDKWLVGEVGTQRNITATGATWQSTVGASSSKNDWIREFGRFIFAYNADPSHLSKCVALQYFMSAGRTYTGDSYLSTSIHHNATGMLVPGITGEVATSAALPTLSNGENGTRYITTSPKKVWQWNGTAWADTGITYISESWQLWWNDDGSGWDGVNSAYYAWKDVTSSYGITS